MIHSFSIGIKTSVQTPAHGSCLCLCQGTFSTLCSPSTTKGYPPQRFCETALQEGFPPQRTVEGVSQRVIDEACFARKDASSASESVGGVPPRAWFSSFAGRGTAQVASSDRLWRASPNGRKVGTFQRALLCSLQRGNPATLSNSATRREPPQRFASQRTASPQRNCLATGEWNMLSRTLRPPPLQSKALRLDRA